MNRQERRRLEKQFGLMKQYQNGTPAVRSAIRERRREMGVKLHEQHLENVHNAQIKAEEDREARTLQGLISAGWSEEKAKEIVANNKKIAEAREEKLRMRRIKQTVGYKNEA